MTARLRPNRWPQHSRCTRETRRRRSIHERTPSSKAMEHPPSPAGAIRRRPCASQTAVNTPGPGRFRFACRAEGGANRAGTPRPSGSDGNARAIACREREVRSHRARARRAIASRICGTRHAPATRRRLCCETRDASSASNSIRFVRRRHDETCAAMVRTITRCSARHGASNEEDDRAPASRRASARHSGSSQHLSTCA